MVFILLLFTRVVDSLRYHIYKRPEYIFPCKDGKGDLPTRKALKLILMIVPASVYTVGRNTTSLKSFFSSKKHTLISVVMLNPVFLYNSVYTLMTRCYRHLSLMFYMQR